MFCPRSIFKSLTSHLFGRLTILSSLYVRAAVFEPLWLNLDIHFMDIRSLHSLYSTKIQFNEFWHYGMRKATQLLVGRGLPWEEL